MSARARHARKAKASEAATHAEDVDSEDDEPARRAPARAAFALLMDDDDDDDDNEEEVEDQVSPAQPEQALRATATIAQQDEETAVAARSLTAANAELPAPRAGLSKKARKRANKKATAAEELDSLATPGDGDELKMLAASAAANAASLRAKAISAVWTVDAGGLDADAELRRKFGSRAVRAAQRDMLLEGRHHGGRGRSAPTPRRVLLVTPKPEWGRPHGLIKMVARERLSGASGHFFTFEWSEEYVRLHHTFEMIALSSPDPNMLVELVRQQPCHIGALLQLHEIATSTGQVERAAEYLQRAVWAHEASYSPGFTSAWLRGEVCASLPQL